MTPPLKKLASAERLDSEADFAGSAEKRVATRWWKRPMDLFVIAVSLPITAPIGLMIACFIKLVSPGPVFFIQTRIGLAEKPFQCLKFRTMTEGAGEDVHNEHLAHLISGEAPMVKLCFGDPRVIPHGRLLRATGLDELPQFINILRGEMSLIGPRPCTQYEHQKYRPGQKERFQATPGITGLWQVSGKNRTSFGEMIRHDIHYVRHVSFSLDCQILARTPGVILEGTLDLLRHWRRGGGALPRPENTALQDQVPTLKRTPPGPRNGES